MRYAEVLSDLVRRQLPWRITRLRDQHHLTKGQLAHKTSLAPSTISQLERGVFQGVRFETVLSLAAFFEPDPSITDHMSFVTRFWQVLQLLHEHDRHPATDRTPDDPLWEFAFEGCEMFVVGASPTYQRRRSRNLGPGMVLIFQPRSLFIDPATSQPIAAPVRQRIHKRMLAYDGMTVHPDIGLYGDHGNREWKQYALPDDNEPETSACPFHTRTNDVQGAMEAPQRLNAQSKKPGIDIPVPRLQE